MFRTLQGGLLFLSMVWAVASACADEQARIDLLFHTAMSDFQFERYEDAANTFQAFMGAAPHDPRSELAQYYAARCFQLRNYQTRAIEEFGYVIEDFPESRHAVLALHERAQCYLQTREPEKAIQDMEGVVTRTLALTAGADEGLRRQMLENQHADVLWLATTYRDRQAYDLAIAAYRRLPDPMEAFRYVVDVYYGLQQYDTVRELIDTLQGTHRHEGFKYLIEFYGNRKAVNQLKGIFSRLLREQAPDQATDDLTWTTATSLGQVSAEQGDWALKAISQFYPRLARRADFELARAHGHEAAYRDTLELFVLTYKSGGDVDAVLRWKGLAQERQGLAAEARQDYRRMSDAGLGHWYAAETYHGAEARAPDVPGAIVEYAALRQAFYSMEWAALAQWRIAELLRAQQQVDAAVEAFRQITQRFADVRIADGYYRDRLREFGGLEARTFGPAAQLAAGDVLRDARRYEDALLEYRAAIRTFPTTEEAAWAAYRCGLCYEGLADPASAIKAFKAALHRYPKTAAGSDAHTRLESNYAIADTEVSDEIDIFADGGGSAGQKEHGEAPGHAK